MVKLGWFLVPKVRSYRVSVDYEDIDEMVNRKELDYDSLSLLLFLSLWVNVHKVSLLK